MSYSSGAFTADYIGNTGLGQSCSQIGCHTSGGTIGADTNRLRVRVLDASNTDVNNYILNQTYTVEVKFRLDGCTKAGFQCTPLWFIQNTKAGTITNNLQPNLVQLNNISAREYTSHTTAGGTVAGFYTSWKFSWQAPSVATEAIAFHCAVNRTNNNSFETGDTAYITTKILQVPSVVSAINISNKVHIYPNPVVNTLYFDVENKEHTSATIIDMLGNIYMQKELNNASNNIDVTSLAKGTYLFVLKNKDSYGVKPFAKY